MELYDRNSGKRQGGVPLALFGAVVLALICTPTSFASSVLSLTANSSYPTGYSFYSYTAADGSAHNNVAVAPYPVTLNQTGVFSNTSAYAFCFDINNPTSVGQAYTGTLQYNTDIATMEATYLMNQLNLLGLYSAATSIKGQISMAIWAIMFPSSTKTDGASFAADPAATTWQNQANQAVTSGQWTVADSNLYPMFAPDNTSSQRFGLVLPGTAPVSPTPEPGTIVLLGMGCAMLTAGTRYRRIRKV